MPPLRGCAIPGFFSSLQSAKGVNPIMHFPAFAFARIIETAQSCGPSAYAKRNIY
jgi:hypothetical protein